MGKRVVETPDAPEQERPRGIQVDANKVVARLQQHRAELQAEIDVLHVALMDSQERETQMLARIAELEDGVENG